MKEVVSRETPGIGDVRPGKTFGSVIPGIVLVQPIRLRQRADLNQSATGAFLQVRIPEDRCAMRRIRAVSPNGRKPVMAADDAVHL
jgi:hypothetical protein